MTTPTKTTALTKQEAKQSPLYALGQRFQIDPAKLVDVLRGTIIKPDKNGKQASNEEVAAFCIVANQYGLSPFTREIHAFSSSEKGLVPIVGIDGWAKIVNTHPQFDGCDFEAEVDDKDVPVNVTCIMHIKGRAHPVKVTERYSECKRNTIPWNTMPHRMLRHKAFMQAARYAFSISGIFDEDEARDIVAGKVLDINTDPLPIGMPRAIGEGKKEAPITTVTDDKAEAADKQATDAVEETEKKDGGEPDPAEPKPDKPEPKKEDKKQNLGERLWEVCLKICKDGEAPLELMNTFSVDPTGADKTVISTKVWAVKNPQHPAVARALTAALAAAGERGVQV